MGTNARLGRPKAGDSADTYQRLLIAARARFARDGYRSTTNRAIADDVGITSGAIYHYVDSKADLYAEVFGDTVAQVYGAFEEAAAGETTLIDQFTAVLNKASELQAVDPASTAFIAAIGQETERNPDLAAVLEPQRGRHGAFFLALVQAAADRGELHTDVDVTALADLLGGVMSGLTRLAASARDPERYAAAVEVLERFFDGSLVTR